MAPPDPSPSPGAASPEPGARRRIDVPALGALLLALGHALSFSLAEPLRTDARYYTYYAWRVANGDVPHRDFLAVKTQLSTLVGALLHGVADVLGVDPLAFTRAGFLVLSAAVAFLVFVVLRAATGRALAGFLGLLATCAFPFLAYLPSLGVFPKLLMTVFAWAAAWAVAKGRWVWAGAAGTLAVLDWQLGGLVLVGVAVSAATSSPRGPSLRRFAAGATLAALPLFAWYLVSGALGPAFQQSVVELFDRSSESSRPLPARFAQLGRCIRMACPGGSPLLWTALAGVPVAFLALRSPRWRAPLTVLLIHHGGVAAFSLLDFQWYGDLYVVVHAALFFLGALIAAIVLGLERFAWTRLPVVSIVAVGVALVLVQPGIRAVDYVLPARGPGSRNASLADQQEIAARVRELVGDRRLGALGTAELMYLVERKNPLPVVWFNDWAWMLLRESPEETKEETATRLVREAELEAVLPSVVQPLDAERLGFEAHRLVSESGDYKVDLLLRP